MIKWLTNEMVFLSICKDFSYFRLQPAPRHLYLATDSRLSIPDSRRLICVLLPRLLATLAEGEPEANEVNAV